MPGLNRSTLTFDGKKLPCISSRVLFETTSDHQGMPNMGSLNVKVRCWIDFHDSDLVPNSTVKALFDAANVVNDDKIKQIKIEFWTDNKADKALCSYSFKGWVKFFEMVNPVASLEKQAENVQNDAGLNHLLIVDLHPAMDKQNASAITMGN